MGIHIATVLRIGGREGWRYILPQSKQAVQWALGPQHLLPVLLFWTGRSLEGSWSHFSGLIRPAVEPIVGVSGLPPAQIPPQTQVMGNQP